MNLLTVIRMLQAVDAEQLLLKTMYDFVFSAIHSIDEPSETCFLENEFFVFLEKKFPEVVEEAVGKLTAQEQESLVKEFADYLIQNYGGDE